MCFYNFEDSDPLNKLGRRNKKNTFIGCYNCAGFALNTFSWYCPYDKEEDYKKHCFICKTDEQMEEVTQRCIDQMLEDFPTLRVIDNLKELKSNEYAIAFRISCVEDDFHYCVRKANGKWYEKIGGLGIRNVTKHYVLSEEWGISYPYLGKVVLLAKVF